MRTSLEFFFSKNGMSFVPSSLLWVPGAREIFGTDSLVLHNRTRLESYLGFCLPSLKLTCSMLPAPPSPSITSTLFMNWGRSFGIRFLESTIKAVNMRVGAIGHANSWVIHVTPMFYLTVLFLERDGEPKACLRRWRATSCTYIVFEGSLRCGNVWCTDDAQDVNTVVICMTCSYSFAFRSHFFQFKNPLQKEKILIHMGGFSLVGK